MKESQKNVSWEPVARDAGIWVADYRIPGLPCRTTAAVLENGGLVLDSPGAGLVDTLPAELLEAGKPEILLAPNNYHHMGLKTWQNAWPDAIVVASEGAIPRLRKQGHFNVQPLERLRERCPAHLDVVEPPSNRIGETWLRFESEQGVGWVVGDTFFNMQKVSKRLLPRIMTTVLQSAPGLRISGLMKWGGIRSRKAYSDWLLTRIDTDKPTILIPQHGDVLVDSGLPDRLRALVLSRL